MSAISKRLFLGARKIAAPGEREREYSEDNASVTSDISTNTTEKGWMQRLR
jgi:hypothetical protein